MKKNIFFIGFLISIVFITSLICLEKLPLITSFINCKKDKVESSYNTSETKNEISEIITEQDFENLKQENASIVVKIYADWCGGCQYVNTFLPALQEQFKKDVIFYSINADNEKVMDLLSKSTFIEEPIAYLPTFLLIKNGAIKKQIVGTKEFAEMSAIIKKTFDV